MSNEKRTLIFFSVSLAVLLAYYTGMMYFFPPKPAREAAQADPQAAPADAGKPGEKPAEQPAEKPGEKPAEKKPADAQPNPPPAKPAGEPAAIGPQADAPPPPDVPEFKLPQRYATAGSVDPEGDYRMLVTFNSRGAAVERIEMAGERYRDIEDNAGYFGHLALTTEPGGGCKVQVVGAGTPAANAVCAAAGVSPGLRVGDVIRKFNGAPVDSRATLEALQSKTKPGDTVEMEVLRDVGGTVRPLPFTLTLGRRPLEVVSPQTSSLEGQTFDDPLSLLWTLQRLGDRVAANVQTEIEGLPSLRDSQWGTIALPLGQPGQALHEPTPEERATALPSDTLPGVKFYFKLPAAQIKTFGLDGDLYLVKSYHLVSISEAEAQGGHEHSYSLELELALFYTGSTPQQLVWQLDGPTGLPLEGWWYTNKVSQSFRQHVGARDIVWRTRGGPHMLVGCAEIVDQYAPTDPDKPYRNLGKAVDFDYVGVDAQYFSAVLLPSDATGPEPYTVASADALPVSHGDKKKDPTYRTRADITFRLTSQLIELTPADAAKPGPTWQKKFVLFAGPKDRELLAHYELNDVVNYGWWWFISPVILSILNFFYAITGNYGISIVLLTVLVRGCMFPLSLRAVKNAAKMQELKPELDKIATKYKNDLEARGRAQQELFRKHNYNPMAGCLPMFLQLPVFMGLYRALQVSIELRQAPLIPGLAWCSNLAGPDKLYFWEPYLPAMLAAPTGYFGPFFNLLPMITVTLFLINQKLMMPPATDEQTKMQQQMMTVMTVMMGVMFFKVPAGLCIYFITSSIWGVCERKLLPKTQKPGTAAKDSKK